MKMLTTNEQGSLSAGKIKFPVSHSSFVYTTNIVIVMMDENRQSLVKVPHCFPALYKHPQQEPSAGQSLTMEHY